MLITRNAIGDHRDEYQHLHKVNELERENAELRRQLGVHHHHHDHDHGHGYAPQPVNYSCGNTPQQYERMLDYNHHLEREALELQNKILRQLEEYRMLTSYKPECEFKQKYINLLKKSQRRR